MIFQPRLPNNQDPRSPKIDLQATNSDLDLRKFILMHMTNKTIKTFEYLHGKEFTENLKKVTGCKTFKQLAKLTGTNKATFSTWNLHNRTSHELMVRLALREGVPLEELALQEQELKQYQQNRAKLPTETDLGYQYKITQTSGAEEIAESSNSDYLVSLDSFQMHNGQLQTNGKTPYSLRLFKNFAIENAKLIEIVSRNCIYLIDQNSTDAVSGKYLIDIDGRLSVNTIQRLPKKLTVDFEGTVAEVSDKDIEVKGKVVLTLEA
ncbi:phage repressor protein CI [Vibrio sp. SCSIO 43137]|uniref:phage repressor protein CI n=1 Tax=Vibrio sp. SCSIO 43137 TaxID=3021011 RepID=UPI002307A34D|nr:phage repressor protein CI [Vibrio sp. SCSIO 43137]WCE31536.1 phage repressor protein CI [Vibrio sp. SCSIO 43137]